MLLFVILTIPVFYICINLLQNSDSVKRYAAELSQTIMGFCRGVSCVVIAGGQNIYN